MKKPQAKDYSCESAFDERSFEDAVNAFEEEVELQAEASAELDAMEAEHHQREQMERETNG